MNILVSLPVQHAEIASIDHVLDGNAAISGTYGSFIRLAGFLAQAGFQVVLSASSAIASRQFPCIAHDQVDPAQFDRLVVHESHWNGASFTFGHAAIAKAILWAQVRVSPAIVYTFFLEGGLRLVCPSQDHANYYRALPQWQQKVVVLANTYNPIFTPLDTEFPTSRLRLLFIGAIAPSKGFLELTKVWTYLAQQGANLELAIAGSRQLHALSDQTQLAPSGLADVEMEKDCIQPWLKALPGGYQPHFLGALSPMDLRVAFAQAWAAIVNPGWSDPETFCVSAVEAQACNRTVFSIKCGALKETIYQGQLQTTVSERTPEALGDCILRALPNLDAVVENGVLAGNFVREQFKQEAIATRWVKLLTDQHMPSGLSKDWDETRNLVLDVLRTTGTGMLFHQNRHQVNKQIMATYRRAKAASNQAIRRSS